MGVYYNGFSPEAFLIGVAVVFTALLGWVGSAIFLVGGGKSKSKKALHWSAKPLKPLLAYVLGKEPRSPGLVKVVSGCDNIRLSWTCPTTSVWNENYYEVQMGTPDEGIQKELGSEFVRSYHGRERTYFVDRLPQGITLKFRVRCINQSGTSKWTPLLGSTTRRPERCGGTDRDYSWNQTNEFVEIVMEVPREITNKNLKIDVKANRIRAECVRMIDANANRVLLEGMLYKAVKASDLVDWTWELETIGDTKYLKIELEKSVVAAKKQDLWPRVLEDGLDYDVELMKWEPAWDEEWRHVMKSEAMRSEANKAGSSKLDPNKISLANLLSD
jgi:hypothetical protein